MISYYHATKSWYEENEHKLSPLRKKVFRVWLKKMRRVCMKTIEERQQREYERQEIIKKAMDAADLIILDGSDGSCEETNFLTAEVAERMMKRALFPFNLDMLKKDME